MARKYIVQKGDNLWNIAKANNMSLEELIRLNPNSKNVIYPNDVLRLEPDKITQEINIRQERQREQKLNLENITAIQGYKHNNNYVVIDKKNRNLTIYDKDNNPLYTTSDFATGVSGNDYNTITYTDDKGRIISGKGNNSTPAGILEVSGKGVYHGLPSFTRARINKDGTKEDVASSIHWGNIGKERCASNGCIRVGGKTLQEMEPFINTGTRIYTLPEQKGSKFTLKGGKLNFTADNPYGISLTSQTAENDKLKERVKEEQERYKQQYGENWKEKYDEDYNKRFWDDYNTIIDKSYSPLKLKWNKTGDEEYDNNRKTYAATIINNKKDLQERFNLSSDEYNHLAELALGIAEQESKFGTSLRYKGKQMIGETGVSYLKGLKSDMNVSGIISKIASLANVGTIALDIYNTYKKGNKQAQSRGITQIKNKSDNKELQEIYKDLNITDESIKTTDKAALATIARLAYMYNTEVRGRNFKNRTGKTIDPYIALLYKWNGHNEELTNKTATPEDNEYIRNVRTYAKNFDMFETRTYNKYKYGGRISLED